MKELAKLLKLQRKKSRDWASRELVIRRGGVLSVVHNKERKGYVQHWDANSKKDLLLRLMNRENADYNTWESSSKSDVLLRLVNREDTDYNTWESSSKSDVLLRLVNREETDYNTWESSSKSDMLLRLVNREETDYNTWESSSKSDMLRLVNRDDPKITPQKL